MLIPLAIFRWLFASFGRMAAHDENHRSFSSLLSMSKYDPVEAFMELFSRIKSVKVS